MVPTLRQINRERVKSIMAPIKKSVVAQYIDKIDKRGSDAARADNEKQVVEREAQVQRGELASQLKRTSIEDDEDNAKVTASSSTVPRPQYHQRDLEAIDSGAAAIMSGAHGKGDLPVTPIQPYITPAVPSGSNTRIQGLELELAMHDESIEKLEAEREDLVDQIEDLKTRRNEAEQARNAAEVAGEEDRRRHAELVASPRQLIEERTQDRMNADRDIQELNGLIRDLRNQLNAERREREIRTAEINETAAAEPTVPTTIETAPIRHSSMEKNGKRGHERRKSFLAGIPIGVDIKMKVVDDKEEKKKKKNNHK